MDRDFPVFKITNLKVTDITSKLEGSLYLYEGSVYNPVQNSMLTNTYILHTKDTELKNRGYAGR